MGVMHRVDRISWRRFLRLIKVARKELRVNPDVKAEAEPGEAHWAKEDANSVAAYRRWALENGKSERHIEAVLAKRRG